VVDTFKLQDLQMPTLLGKIAGNDSPKSWHGKPIKLMVSMLAFLLVAVIVGMYTGPTLTASPAITQNIVAKSESSVAKSESSGHGILTRKCDKVYTELQIRSLPNGGTIYRKTNCPLSDAWLQDYLNNYLSTEDNPFIFLNLGCNKGFDSIRVARAVTRNQGIFNKTRWRQAIEIDDQGACRQAVDMDPLLDPALPQQPIIVHCVEAMPSTAAKLQNAAVTTEADKHGLMIHNYALTGTPGGGSVLFPNKKAGVEYLGLGDCANPIRCSNVTSITVDEFISKHVGQIYTKSGAMIPYLSIDVEGYDFTIMKAALETLKRTKYLEFEFHSAGDWGKQNLKDAIDMLQQEAGFVCYWSGVNQLWRITGCWVDVFGSFHQWSNVACVAPERALTLAEKMEEVFGFSLAKTLSDELAKIPA
jgi:FkbM family methyltransferase